MVGKSLLFGVLSVLLSFVEPIGRPSYSTSFYSETPCIGQDAELFLDNLPSGNKLFLAEEIVVSPLFEAPCVSFSSDRFSIYPERGDFHLIPKEEKDADSFSTTELVFANGKESFSWRLYTYINRFGQETFSRADKSDAIFENNLYLYRSGKIDEDTYKANVSSISHGDLELVYDFSERKFYVPWNESDSFAKDGQLGTRTVKNYSGFVNLEDCLGTYHGLQFLRIYLIGKNDSTNTYDVISYYDLGFNGSFFLSSPSTGYSDIYFRIYAACSYCSFIDTNSDVYFVDLIHTSIIPDSFSAYHLYIPLTWWINPVLWAVSIGRASHLYAEYLYGASINAPLTFFYGDHGTVYLDSHQIEFKTSMISLTSGHCNKPQNWDVVSHEYGHHIVKVLGLISGYQSNYLDGNHDPSHSDCEDQYDFLHYKYSHDPNYFTVPITLNQLDYYARGNGLALAWGESWPSFFGNCMQNYFYDYLAGIPTCCNNRYDYSLSSYFNYPTAHGTGTDSCEEAILCFLYNLNDSNNDNSFDYLSISDQTLFNILLSNPCYTFNQYYLALLDYGIDENYLGALLDYVEICPRKTDLDLSLIGTMAQFELDFSDHHVHFGFESCDFVFYALGSLGYSQVASYHTTNKTITVNASLLQALAINDALYLKISLNYASDDFDDYYSSRYFTINTATMEVV